MFVFLLPYVCACLWGHAGAEKDALRADGGKEGDAGYRIQADMEWGVWELSLEEYIAYKLEAAMPKAYEPEALKAQAVLLRTEVVRAGQGREGRLFRVSGDGLEKWYGADREEQDALSVYAEAARETEGLYLAYHGEPAQTPYFRISNGLTRDAGAVWETDSFPYLKSVSCTQDKAARDYRSETAVSKMKFLRAVQDCVGTDHDAEKLWEGVRFDRDDAGYVTDVRFYEDDEEVGEMDGEAFRYLFGLSSASFEIRRTDTQIIFDVTGVGHGFGMSQYSANCKAINGETFDQILQDFFRGTELAKIE